MKNGTATHLVLDTASLHLVCENLCAGLLGFSFMDVFHEHALVLEHITLGFLVKRVIPAPPKKKPSAHPNSTLKNKKENPQMLINLPRLPILPQQPPQHPLPPHPKHLSRHPRLTRSLPLSRARMSPLPLRSQQRPRPRARMHRRGLNQYMPLFDQLLDVRAGIGVADFCLFGGVEPDFTFADAGDGRGEPLLGA